MISQILFTVLGICGYLFLGLMMFYVAIDAEETDDIYLDDIRLFFMLLWPFIILFGFMMIVLLFIGRVGKRVDLLIRKTFKK